MKGIELRIGNLVQFKNEFYHIASIGSDETIRLKCEDSTHRSYYHGTIGCYKISWVQPIPLTEEWFVKFGFEKTSLHYFKKDGIIILSEDDFFECLLGSVVVKLQYVHQLQNLYFNLTGEELTIGGQDETH